MNAKDWFKAGYFVGFIHKDWILESWRNEYYTYGFRMGQRDHFSSSNPEPDPESAWREFTQFKGDQQHWGAL